jgi:vacuolar-type H+-ATPase subunit E/Vma4
MRLSLEQRTAALLALVDEYRASRCAELLEPAREQARALLRSARAEGRRRVHTTIAELRQRLAAEVGAARARLATEQRLARQQQAVRMLQHAWSALREALRARWRDPLARGQWLDAHLNRALAALPREGWQIEFSADWPAAEREAFAERIAAAGVTGAQWQARQDIDGGVRIRAGSNAVDATIDGLLADRPALEGRLLDLLREDSR